jgi:hypothetical protein
MLAVVMRLLPERRKMRGSEFAVRGLEGELEVAKR